MAAHYHQDIVSIDLDCGNIHRSFLHRSIGKGDSNANRFGVRVFRGKDAVDLSGVSCQGFFRNSNGENIALTSYGTVEGNKAFVTLPQVCYNYEGQFTLAIKLVGGGITGTMRIIDGMVDNTNTGSAVAPTESVPTYQEVLAAYEEAVEAVATIENLEEQITEEVENFEGQITEEVENLEGQITHIMHKSNYINNAGTGANSDVYAYTGDVIEIEVNSYTGGEWYAWIDGDTENFITIDAAKSYTLIAETDGYVKLRNSNNSGTMNCDIHIVTIAETRAMDGTQNILKGLQKKTEYTNNSGTGANSAFYAYAGSIVCVDVKSITGGEWYAWISGDTSNVVALITKGQRAFIKAEIDGFVRLRNNNNSGTINCELSFKPHNENLLVSPPNMNGYDLNTNIVFQSFEAQSVNYSNPDVNMNIYNYSNYAAASSVAKTSPVIQIRNNEGELIYKGLDIHDKNSIESGYRAICAITFDKYGNFANRIEYIDYKSRSTSWLENEYFVILVEYPTVYASLYWTIENVFVSWLNPNDAGKAYYVGTGKDFDTLTEALVALANDASNKILYITAGTYDIYEEMGGDDYFDSLPSLEMSAWRQYCNLIPPNTKLIGIGKVVLRFDYPYTKNKDVFSCLNTSTGTYIENITVKQTGGRYGIHLEGAALPETLGNSYVLKNVNVETNGANYTIGIGMNRLTDLEFIGCILKRVDKQNGACVYHHTNHHDLENISFVDCIVDGGIALQNTADYTDGENTVLVKIINTYLDLLKIYAVMEGVTGSDYNVITYGVNNYTLQTEQVTAVITTY